MTEVDTETSSSDEEEKNNSLFKEAANCDYVNKLYHNNFSNLGDTEKHKSNKSSRSEDSNIDLGSHQMFIAERLRKRLDRQIEVIAVDSVSKERTSAGLSPLGIQLLRDSVYINEILETDSFSRKRPDKGKYKERYYVERAKEAAVSPDWVMSKQNSYLWSSNKKPKIINMKVKQKLPGNKLECDVISSVNISDKFKLI